MQSNKDERLWRMASKRAAFRKSLYSYIIVIAFLWGVWWFTTGRIVGRQGYPWPVWIMLGWGIGIAFQYFNAYNGNKQDMAEEEYEKLKRQEKM